MGKKKRVRYICAVCKKEEIDIEEKLFQKGWDYPPNLGEFRVVSPRTCPDCPITKTLWWAINIEHKNTEELTNDQRQTLARILSEPNNIYVN